MTPPRGVPESRVLPVLPPSSSPPGRLILRVLVAEDGRAAEIEVVRAPYGAEALKADAIAAVRTWRYTPAMRDGGAVACWMVESVEFATGSPPPAAAPALAPRAAAPQPDRPPPATTPIAVAPQDTVEESAPPVADPAPAAAGSAPASQGATPAVPAAPIPVPPPFPEPLPDAGPATALLDPSRPAARRQSQAPRIDLARGGPPPLELGGSVQEAAAYLGADPEADPVRAADRGLEVTLTGSDGERRVAAIRYLFADGRDGFRATSLRTRSGLGKGSACLGIPAAQGRPTTRTVAEEGGVRVERLGYEGDGVVATFLCVDGRLAEMTITEVERAGAN